MGFTGNLRKSMAEMLFPYNLGGGLFSAGRWLLLVDRSKDVMMFLDVCNLLGLHFLYLYNYFCCIQWNLPWKQLHRNVVPVNQALGRTRHREDWLHLFERDRSKGTKGYECRVFKSFKNKLTDLKGWVFFSGFMAGTRGETRPIRSWRISGMVGLGGSFHFPGMEAMEFAMQHLCRNRRAICLDKHGNMLNAWYNGPVLNFGGSLETWEVFSVHRFCRFASIWPGGFRCLGFNIENKPGVPETVFISRCQEREERNQRAAFLHRKKSPVANELFSRKTCAFLEGPCFLWNFATNQTKILHQQKKLFHEILKFWDPDHSFA